MSLLTRIVSGDSLRRTRFHDYENHVVGVTNLAGLPRAVTTAALLRFFGWRPEMPWLGFSAVRTIDHLLERHWQVLEFGSGMLTLWFARRVAKTVTIETDAAWHARVSALLQKRHLYSRVESRLVPTILDGLSLTLPRGFDFALVDGVSRDVAMRVALSVVRPGGYIYLDNSDVPWPEYRAAREELLEAQEPTSSAKFFTDFCVGYVAVSQGLLVELRSSPSDVSC